MLSQGDRFGVGPEATGGDVEHRPREPAGAFRPVGQVDHGLVGSVELDRQGVDHGCPEAGPVPDRPGPELGLGRETQPVQEAAEVAPGPDVVGRDPGRGRSLPRVPGAVRLLEEVLVDRGRMVRPEDLAAEVGPLARFVGEPRRCVQVSQEVDGLVVRHAPANQVLEREVLSDVHGIASTVRVALLIGFPCHSWP